MAKTAKNQNSFSVHEKILLISDKEEDLCFLEEISIRAGFVITRSDFFPGIQEKILKENYSVVLVDYAIIQGNECRISDFQKDPSRACVIFYGDNVDIEEISELLQKGVYSFIPRSVLSKRICVTILEGIEHHKALIEVLDMFDELKVLKKDFSNEKKAHANTLQNLDRYKRSNRESVIDDLTGLHNKRGFDDLINKEIHRAKGNNSTPSLVILDVINIKDIRNGFGQQAEACAIVHLARDLERVIRRSDSLARYAKDSFSLLLPETDCTVASAFMERVTTHIDPIFEWESEKIKIEVSCRISDIGGSMEEGGSYGKGNTQWM